MAHQVRPSCSADSPGHPVRLCRALRRVLLAVCLCALLAAGLAAPPVAAQQQQPQPDESITLDIRPGYNGDYRVSEWFPVTIIASNDGPDVRGVLEWSYPARDESIVFRQTIDLPQGARKRIMFNALSNTFARTAELRLLVDGEVRQSWNVSLNPIEAERFIVGVLSSDVTLLNSLASMELLNTSGTNVVRLDAEIFAENAIALAGIDAIFVHDIPTADLNPEQQAALRTWVQLGGQLVLGGGVHAEDTTAAFQDALPVTLNELRSDASLQTLNELVRRPELDEDTRTTVNAVTLRPAATRLDTDMLLTAAPLGAGRVIFSAFDLAALRAWTGEPNLWQEVLSAEPAFAPATSFRWQNSNLLSSVLQLPALQLPSFGVLLLFVVGYILAVGPLNFLVLRRMKRIDRAWITIPLTVLLFVVGTYSAGMVIRGVRPQVMQVALVQSYEGSEQGKVTTFMGIFSPRRSTYTLSFAPETFVSTGRFDSTAMNETPLIWTEDATTLQNVLVDVSLLRTFIIEQTTPVELVVSSELERQGQNVLGSVQNDSAIALNGALLVYGDSVQQLGNLGPGEAQTFDLTTFTAGAGSFPSLANAESEGLINRQAVLNNLFDPNRFVGGFPPVLNSGDASVLDQRGVYLMGWHEQPYTEVAVDGFSGTQQGLTLYVVRLEG